jgi:hypothetical protein
MNSTKCKISEPVHVSRDLTSAENTRIGQNEKSPLAESYHGDRLGYFMLCSFLCAS